VYFFDSAGNVLEFIARHTLKNSADGPFTPRDILYASEIGIVTEDVQKEVAGIRGALGLDPYLGLTSPEFTAVGTSQSLLIVVKRNRIWFPTPRQEAARFAARVRIRGAGVEEREATICGSRVRLDP
jgi:hypothetical protein